MKNIKSHFKFNKQERSGIFFLLLIIVLLQVGYFVFLSFPTDKKESLIIDTETQAQINFLKDRAIQKDSKKIYPFNPNFITDYKGYSLGMSVEEIGRLHAYRARDKYVNTPEDFQKVTQVSDSLLSAVSPYFKFPEWTKKGGKRSSVRSKQYKVGNALSPPSEGLGEDFSNDAQIKDLNSATAEDLKEINGIGEKLSARIIKFRDRLGGFLINEQLYDVYGLEAQVVARTLKRFKVLNAPTVEKINVNSATVQELQKLVYLQKNVAIGIVNYRNDNGIIVSFDELIKIEDFPAGKIDRIALYLSL